ncbi:MAG: hypothetical protein JWR55_2100 [Aeromicrobium sp.]|jgi:hypothetical protein|nr:hypothetical protein [Aeromicrobium sp.]
MTVEHLVTVYGTAVMVCGPDGIPFDTEGAATELVGEAIGLRAEVVVVPAERLTDDFFQLRTGVAGEIAQKFANYGLRLAIIGDISRQLAGSTALAEWVEESNRGDDLRFYDTFDEFQARLDRRRTSRPM